MSGIITLTSDWGNQDHYVAAVKMRILSYFREATIVDVTHMIPIFDAARAAFFLRQVYPDSPPGTVHILAMNTIGGSNHAHLIVCHSDQYFVGTDNGAFSLLFDTPPSAIYEITEMQDSNCFVFPSRDLFAKVAAQLAQGTPPERLGVPTKMEQFVMRSQPVLRFEKNADGSLLSATLMGEVTFFDRYQNVHTNITEALFRQTATPFSAFEIQCIDPIRKLSSAYADVKESEALALFDSSGYLQIAMNGSTAASLLNFHMKTPICITFHNNITS